MARGNAQQWLRLQSDSGGLLLAWRDLLTLSQRMLPKWRTRLESTSSLLSKLLWLWIRTPRTSSLRGHGPHVPSPEPLRADIQTDTAFPMLTIRINALMPELWKLTHMPRELARD